MRLILLALFISYVAAQCGMPNQLYPDLCQPTVVTQVLTPTENETIEVYVTAYNQFNQTFVIPLSFTVSGNSTPIINIYTSITVPTDSTLIILASMLLITVLVYILKDVCSSHRCRWPVKPATLPEPDLRAVAV
jgi:hypothetical protein